LAFDKKQSDDRKTWLVDHIKGGKREIPYGNVENIDISDFIHKDLVNFSIADVKRSIPHLVDGFKPSQRKILHACIKRNLKEEIKVAQLAGYVSETTSYHHGEQSLLGSIINMAQDYVGSNNLNLLEPCGQFGTRLMGGKDAASPRYIFTRLNPTTRDLFNPLDDDILTYLTDDGQKIEPEFFVPTIPMVLVNGADGIGTGFSTNIPMFRIKDIQHNIIRALSNKPLVPMKPWYKGFGGTDVRKSEHVWTFCGVYEDGVVSELPPGKWTQDYREILDKLQVGGVIHSYDNHSTEDKVKFIVRGYEGDDPLHDLKLTKDVRTSNMYLMTPNGIKKYKNAEEIIMDFVEIRKEFYKKRKIDMISKLETKSDLLENKTRFVREVIGGVINVFGKKKKVLVEELKSKKFNHVDDLLNIKTYTYTKESADELEQMNKKTKLTLDHVRGKTINAMWGEDLLKIK